MDFTDKILEKGNFPNGLNRLKNPPNLLYYVGNLELLKMPKISIVGSRKATIYTKNCVLNLAKILKNSGVCIVSGGALGVDISAHIAAMPSTIGVFASGLDIIYPKSNSKQIEQIYKTALALSEYKLGTKPLAHHFLERNRIVIALSSALVVAQADLKSGSMQSARLAYEAGIPVFVFPQRYGESDGTNKLLKEKKATLIDDFFEFASKFGALNISQNGTDEIIEFCKNGVNLDLAFAKFGDKIYEYELEGKLSIENLVVKSL